MDKNKIIGIINQKGGVSKTATTHNLGYKLADKGYKVLLVDFDPQGNLTAALGVDLEKTKYFIQDFIETRGKKDNPLDYKTKLEYAIQEIKPNLNILPSNISLSEKEVELSAVTIGKEKKLTKLLNLIKDKYDFILIDSSPSLGNLTVNVLFAAKYLLVPFKPEYFSLEGISSLTATVDEAYEVMNNEAQILGYLPTMIDVRRNSTTKFINEVKELANKRNEHVFESTIRISTTVSDASTNHKSVFEHQKSSPAAMDYSKFTEEFLKIIEVKS